MLDTVKYLEEITTIPLSKPETTANAPPIKEKQVFLIPSKELTNTSLKRINGSTIPANAEIKKLASNKAVSVVCILFLFVLKQYLIDSLQDTQVLKVTNAVDVEALQRQLVQTRKLLEEYKQKYYKKVDEAERYKQQLRLIMQSRSYKTPRKNM